MFPTAGQIAWLNGLTFFEGTHGYPAVIIGWRNSRIYSQNEYFKKSKNNTMKE